MNDIVIIILHPREVDGGRYLLYGILSPEVVT